MSVVSEQESPDGTSNEATDPELVRLQQGIEQTRANMAGTITQLETRLSPAEVREKLGAELDHVEQRVKVVVREQLSEAKELVQAELAEAKSLLRAEMDEAEEKVKRGLAEARDSIKRDVKDALTGAKHAVRALTVGKVEDLATTIGDKMNETRDTLVDTVRNNPVPAALVGVGLVWLLMNRSKSASRSDRSNGNGTGYSTGIGAPGGRGLVEGVEGAFGKASTAVSNVAHQVTDAAGKGLHQAVDAAGNAAHSASEGTMALAHQAGDAASRLAGQAGDAAASVADGARQGVKRVEEGFSSTLKESPLAVGAAALALGAVVGFSLPRTRGEDSLMGETRDQLLDSAGGAARQAVTTVTEFAERTVESAKKAPQHEGMGASE